MKTVTLDLTTINSNAFALMGAFERQARREGWSEEEINEVINECQSDSYEHLVHTLDKHCEPK